MPDAAHAGPNAIDPDRLTSEERIAEVGRILAAGICRLQAPLEEVTAEEPPIEQSAPAPRVKTGDIQLDFSARKSGVGRERGSRVGGR
jgi:hypothetical protein